MITFNGISCVSAPAVRNQSAQVRFGRGKDYTFFSDRNSSYHQLADLLKASNTDPAARALAERFLKAVVDAKKPVEVASALLEKYSEDLTHSPLARVFPALSALLDRTGDKGLDDQALNLLELSAILGESNETPASRKLTEGFIKALCQKPNAGKIAKDLLLGFHADLTGNPLSRVYLKVRTALKDNHQIELLAMEDFLTSADELGLAEERQLLIDLIRTESAEKPPNRSLLDVATRKLLEGIEAEARFEMNRQDPEYFQRMTFLMPGNSADEARSRWMQKRQAGLALAALETFRQGKSQPPEAVLSRLLEQVEADQTQGGGLYRGKALPAQYEGPVFALPWEERYIQATLPLNREPTYAVGLLKHHPLNSPIGKQAQAHLTNLLNDPLFNWEITSDNESTDEIQLLGNLLQTVLQHPDGAKSDFYKMLRSKVLGLAGLEETGGNARVHYPSIPMTSEKLAKLMVETWLAQWQDGAAMPDDLIGPLMSRGSLFEETPDPTPEEMPNPRPRPERPPEPTRPPVRKKKKRGIWDILTGN